MKAMLSIKPEYVDRILSGEKTYEFRRRIFKRPEVDTIVIYATSPRCEIVGEAEVTDIKTADPESIWLQTGDKGGISKERFMAYFDGRDVAYAIKLGKVKRFDHPRPLSYYAPRVHSAPQSFVYVD